MSTLYRKKCEIAADALKEAHGNTRKCGRGKSEAGVIWDEKMTSEFSMADIHPSTGKRHWHMGSMKATYRYMGLLLKIF